MSSETSRRDTETEAFEQQVREEWENDPQVREEFSGLEAYRAYRVAQAEGRTDSGPIVPEGTAQDELAAHQRAKNPEGSK
jgi:hypothetical protein